MKIASVFYVIIFLFLGQIYADENPQYIHVDAVRFCQSLNRRLPTAREFAKYATEHGAAGILEPSQYKNQPGYEPINRLVADYKTVLDFYYNADGFVSVESGIQMPWLWSASYGPHNIDFVYVFNLKTGEFDFDARIMKNGTRCIE